MTQLITQWYAKEEVVCSTTETLFCMPATLLFARPDTTRRWSLGSIKTANAQDLCTGLALHWSLLDYLNSIN